MTIPSTGTIIFYLLTLTLKCDFVFQLDWYTMTYKCVSHWMETSLGDQLVTQISGDCRDIPKTSPRDLNQVFKEMRGFQTC
jgi:hypothetical protein